MAEAEEKKVTPQEARAKRNKLMNKNKRLLAEDAMIVLSDE